MNIDTPCVWIVDGEIATGTLGLYANQWERCQEADVSLSAFVWTVSSIGGLDQHKVHVTGLGRDADDLLHYELTVYGFSMRVRVDGRA
jgi:hypothetical protein